MFDVMTQLRCYSWCLGGYSFRTLLEQVCCATRSQALADVVLKVLQLQ